ncbi:uncharacterized protein LOC144446375 [Glandiceps talaboti]
MDLVDVKGGWPHSSSLSDNDFEADPFQLSSYHTRTFSGGDTPPPKLERIDYNSASNDYGKYIRMPLPEPPILTATCESKSKGNLPWTSLQRTNASSVVSLDNVDNKKDIISVGSDHLHKISGNRFTTNSFTPSFERNCSSSKKLSPSTSIYCVSDTSEDEGTDFTATVQNLMKGDRGSNSPIILDVTVPPMPAKKNVNSLSDDCVYMPKLVRQKDSIANKFNSYVENPNDKLMGAAPYANGKDQNKFLKIGPQKQKTISEDYNANARKRCSVPQEINGKILVDFTEVPVKMAKVDSRHEKENGLRAKDKEEPDGTFHKNSCDFPTKIAKVDTRNDKENGIKVNDVEVEYERKNVLGRNTQINGNVNKTLKYKAHKHSDREKARKMKHSSTSKGDGKSHTASHNTKVHKSNHNVSADRKKTVQPTNEKSINSCKPLPSCSKSAVTPTDYSGLLTVTVVKPGDQTFLKNSHSQHHYHRDQNRRTENKTDVKHDTKLAFKKTECVNRKTCDSSKVSGSSKVEPSNKCTCPKNVLNRRSVIQKYVNKEYCATNTKHHKDKKDPAEPIKGRSHLSTPPKSNMWKGTNNSGRNSSKELDKSSHGKGQHHVTPVSVSTPTKMCNDSVVIVKLKSHALGLSHVCKTNQKCSCPKVKKVSHDKKCDRNVSKNGTSDSANKHHNKKYDTSVSKLKHPKDVSKNVVSSSNTSAKTDKQNETVSDSRKRHPNNGKMTSPFVKGPPSKELAPHSNGRVSSPVVKVPPINGKIPSKDLYRNGTSSSAFKKVIPSNEKVPCVNIHGLTTNGNTTPCKEGVPNKTFNTTLNEGKDINKSQLLLSSKPTVSSMLTGQVNPEHSGPVSIKHNRNRVSTSPLKLSSTSHSISKPAAKNRMKVYTSIPGAVDQTLSLSCTKTETSAISGKTLVSKPKTHNGKVSVPKAPTVNGKVLVPKPGVMLGKVSSVTREDDKKEQADPHSAMKIHKARQVTISSAHHSSTPCTLNKFIPLKTVVNWKQNISTSNKQCNQLSASSSYSPTKGNCFERTKTLCNMKGAILIEQDTSPSVPQACVTVSKKNASTNTAGEEEAAKPPLSQTYHLAQTSSQITIDAHVDVIDDNVKSSIKQPILHALTKELFRSSPTECNIRVSPPTNEKKSLFSVLEDKDAKVKKLQQSTDEEEEDNLSGEGLTKAVFDTTADVIEVTQPLDMRRNVASESNSLLPNRTFNGHITSSGEQSIYTSKRYNQLKLQSPKGHSPNKPMGQTTPKRLKRILGKARSQSPASLNIYNYFSPTKSRASSNSQTSTPEKVSGRKSLTDECLLSLAPVHVSLPVNACETKYPGPSFVSHGFRSRHHSGSEDGKLSFAAKHRHTIEACQEEGRHEAAVQLIRDFVTEERKLPPEILNYIIKDVLLESKDVVHTYAALNHIQNLHPMTQDEMPWDWNFITRVVDKILASSMKGDSQAVYSNILCLEYIVSMLSTDLKENFAFPQKTIATFYLSPETQGSHLNNVISWMLQCVKMMSAADNNLAEAQGNNNHLSQLLSLLQNLLMFSIAVSKNPSDSATKIAEEMVYQYLSLPSLGCRKLLLQTMGSHLVRARLLELLLENCCEIDKMSYNEKKSPGRSAPLSVEKILEYHFKRKPGNQLSLASEERWDCVSKDGEACQELVMMLYSLLQSHIHTVHGKLHMPITVRLQGDDMMQSGSQSSQGSSSGRLTIDDLQRLAEIPFHITQLRNRLGTYCKQFTPRTRLLFQLMEVFQDIAEG